MAILWGALAIMLCVILPALMVAARADVQAAGVKDFTPETITDKDGKNHRDLAGER